MESTHLHIGEKVVLKLRKHPLILIGNLIPYAILDYLPYLVMNLARTLQEANPESVIDVASSLSFDNPWVRFVVGVYWLFIWMGAFGVFIDYYLDLWIVTNERIISINQKSFWRREVASLFLHRVQNVETVVSGVFGTLFGYGKVSVESAGAEKYRTTMHGLAKPDHIRDRILKEVARHEETKNVRIVV